MTTGLKNYLQLLFLVLDRNDCSRILFKTLENFLPINSAKVPNNDSASYRKTISTSGFGR